MQNALRSVVALGLLLCSVAACDIDLVEPSGGTGGTGGYGNGPPVPVGGEGGGKEDGGGGGEPPVCGVCETVPDGFNGFVRLAKEGRPCTAESPVLWRGGLGAEASFEAQPAECGCSCEGLCPSVQGSVTSGGAAQCTDSGGGFTVTIPPSMCVGVPDSRNLKIPASLTDPECTSNNLPALIPPVSFTDPVEVCEAQLVPCDANAFCLPEDGGTYCIYSDTNPECPAGYSDRNVVVRDEDLNDTRDCLCVCGAGDDVCGNMGAFTLYADDTCNVSVPASPISGTCLRTQVGEFNSVLYQPMTQMSCETNFNAIGQVTYQSAGRTFCCR